MGGPDGPQPDADEPVEADDTFWIGTPEQVAARMVEARELGFNTFIAELPAPYDDETLVRWIDEVKPMVRRLSRTALARPPDSGESGRNIPRDTRFP